MTGCGMHGIASAREANMRRCIEEKTKSLIGRMGWWDGWLKT